MQRKAFRNGIVAAMAILVMVPTIAAAQAIAGVARDASGAVLPGVTVEASSPALIEKVRTAVTDSQGLYNIVQLSPGTYTVTFTLPGFATVRREGIVLTTGFTATVNADMSVGGVQETVTVTSEAPIVDTRTVRQTAILQDDVIEVLPTGRTTTGLATLIPGISIGESGLKFQDVGGLAGEGNNFLIHGSRHNEGHLLMNGLPFHDMVRSNTGLQRPDVSMLQEFALETSAISAEYAEGGVSTNLVLKEGGNQVISSFFGSFSNNSMQADNFDDDLRRRGVAAVNALDKAFDASASIGGPIKQNRVWYFGSIRRWKVDNLLAGVFDDSNRRDFLYTPDLTKQSVWEEDITNAGIRMTWQASPRNKFLGYYQKQARTGLAQLLNLMPEAQQVRSGDGPGNMYAQVQWLAPVTSRLLLEAGHSTFVEQAVTGTVEGLPTDSPNWGYSITDSGTGYTYNYPARIGDPSIDALVHSYRGVLSYVTGTHALKAGLTFQHGQNGAAWTEVPRDMTFTFVNGVPNRITMQVSPFFNKTLLNAAMGLYVTDQWTRDRLTLNLGVRFDYNNGSVPAQDQPAGRFLGPRHFDEVTDVPNWKDLSPRLGAVYDLFGDGKTAVKASFSRYLAGGNLTATANAFNPVATTVNSANRDWTDANGNFLPECDFLDPAANGECGRLSNLAFGTNVITTTRDPKITAGWWVRGYNLETTVNLQHELTSRVGVNVGYFHRSYGNFTVTDNTLVTPADYDPYCVTTPVDARLPGGGGQQLCGFYDLRPAKFGQFFGHVTKASNFGKQEDVFDGVDLAVTARLGAGILLQGGTATGRQRTNACFTVDSPQITLDSTTGLVSTPGANPSSICDVRPPFQTQGKLLATIPLPAGFQFSGTYQSYPGPQITATYVVRSADVRASLGRDFSSGPNGTARIEIIPPGTMYADRIQQVDARITKMLTLGRSRVQLNLDAFNIFNGNAVLQHNNVYGTNGAQWLQPSGNAGVMNARLFKISAQLTFQ